MLDRDKLAKELQDAMDELFPPAFERLFLTLVPETTQDGLDKAKEFGQCAKDMISEDLANRFAASIDAYVRNVDIWGFILTTGSPVMQQARIESPSPITNGYIPNTLHVK